VHGGDEEERMCFGCCTSRTSRDAPELARVPFMYSGTAPLEWISQHWEYVVGVYVE
jgi:hypothetical protein